MDCVQVDVLWFVVVVIFSMSSSSVFGNKAPKKQSKTLRQEGITNENEMIMLLHLTRVDDAMS